MNSVAAVPVAPCPLLLNSPQEITKHISLGQLRWAAPFLFLPASIVFMLLGQAGFAAVFGCKAAPPGKQRALGGPSGAPSLTPAASLFSFF
jgi:hypothetical protein